MKTPKILWRWLAGLLWLTGTAGADAADPGMAVGRRGAWPSYPRSWSGVVVTESNRAYLGGGGMVALNVLNPANPTLITNSPSLSFLGPVIRSNLIYCLHEEGRLWIISVTNPANPIVIGEAQTGEDGYELAVEGRYAYMTQGWRGLKILDVNDPTNPVVVGSLSNDSFIVTGVAVRGGLAYLSTEFGLAICSVTNPAAPQLISSLTNNAGCNAIAVEGSTAYLTANNAALWVVNVTNPVSPSTISAWSTPRHQDFSSIIARSNFVFVVEADRVLVWNMANPLAPTIPGALYTRGLPGDLHLDGPYLYVASYGEGLEVLQVAASGALSRIGGFEADGYAERVEVAGTRAYVADGHGDLQIINVNSPAAPARLGRYISHTNVSYATAIQLVGGRYVYIGDRWGGLQVVDVNSPAAPVRVATVNRVNVTDHTGLMLDGSVLYSCDSGGLRVFSVTNPALPAWIGSADMPGIRHHWRLASPYLYGASEYNGLQIFNVNVPAAPFYVGTALPGHEFLCIDIVGTSLFAGRESGPLEIYSLTNPAQPQFVAGPIPNCDEATHITHLENRLFVSRGEEGLTVLDITVPTAPTLLARRKDVYARSTAVVGDRVYVAAGHAGLVIYDLVPKISLGFNPMTNGTMSLVLPANPGMPVTIQYAAQPGSPWTPLLTTNLTAVPATVRDVAPGAPHRIYRAVLP